MELLLNTQLPPLATHDATYCLEPTANEQQQEILIQARCVYHLRCNVLFTTSQSTVLLQEFLHIFQHATAAIELIPVQSQIRTLLSTYNLQCRLRNLNQQVPRRMALKTNPPQTPADFIAEEYGWGGVGMFQKESEWIGHGYWWRSNSDPTQLLDNTGGFCLNDHDTMESNFIFLTKAKIIWCDIPLIKKDFNLDATMEDQEVRTWLLENCAYMSQGQKKRFQHGNDHDGRIVEGIQDFVEEEPKEPVVPVENKTAASPKRKMGMRMRSGGRAAQFFINDQYTIDTTGSNGLLLEGQQIDVKGVGTHIQSDETRKERSGLLGLGDALLELFWQRLLQRLVDNERHEQRKKRVAANTERKEEEEEVEEEVASCSTVQCYALIDTGIQYKNQNPSTGTLGERCVLSVRQRQSRCLQSYNHPSFSGNMDPNKEKGGKHLCSLLYRHGLTAEFWPTLINFIEGEEKKGKRSGGGSGDSVPSISMPAALDAAQGNWNLQADATGRNFVDFSDFYALPNAPLHSAWRMREETFGNCFALISETFLKQALDNPDTRSRLYPDLTISLALEAARLKRQQLSTLDGIQLAASSIDTNGVVSAGKPKNFMCWFLELNDSEMANWVASKAAVSLDKDIETLGVEIQEKLDAWLPAVDVS